MKFNKLNLIIFTLILLLTVTAVNAEDTIVNDTVSEVNDEIVLEANQNTIYVDNFEGNDLNDGSSWDTSVKSFSRALNLSKENDTIYLSSGYYDSKDDTRITIDKSVNIIGSDDTNFDGLDENYIFEVKDNVKVTFKNINFINSYKSPYDTENVYGSALDIKNAHVTVDNCKFINNVINHNTKSAVYGGAISNFGDLTVINSYFNNNIATSTDGLFSSGGAIYNKGRLNIKNSSIYNSKNGIFSYGGAIANSGELTITDSVISDSYISSESKGSAIYNNGELTIINSIIKNNKIEKTGLNQFYGAIFNAGKFTAQGNIFQNNTVSYDSSSVVYRGTGNIFSNGDLNLTYNAFINNEYYPDIAAAVFYNAGEIISLDNNWWDTNSNPYDESKFNLDDEVTNWMTFTLTPEYTPLNISDSVKIKAEWKSIIGNEKIELFPLFNVTFTTLNIKQTKELTGGYAEFLFDRTQNKGQYNITANVSGFTQSVLVDVGKLVSNINYTMPESIEFLDDLVINIKVTGEDTVPTGTAFIYLNSTKYTVQLTDGEGSLKLSDQKPGVYNVRFQYDGDEKYFKAFTSTTLTIKKQPVNITIDIPSIKIDQKQTTATVTLLTKGAQGQAVLYLNGVRKRECLLIQCDTSLTLRNLAEGEYNATLIFTGSDKYDSATVSTVFSVSKYSTVLNVYADDIDSGENATIIIEALPEDLRGEAILSINDVNFTIWINETNTTVNISNLSYGRYDVTVTFLGDQRYYGANDTTSFRVLRQASSLNVTIIENDDDLNGTITVKTNSSNCTGLIGVYINYKFYSMNLTDGEAVFDVEFDHGTNYIFIFYEGDSKFEGSTWNTTRGIVDDFVFIGENSTAFEHNDFTYSIRLLEVTGIPMPGLTVTVHFNGTDYNIATDEDGFAYLPLNLNTGEYNIQATYDGRTINNTLKVKKITFDVETANIKYGNPESIIITCDENLTGNFNMVISDILNITIPIIKGKANYNLTGLDTGKYTVEVRYTNDYYNSTAKSSSFTVEKADLNMTVTFNQNTFTITVNNLENATGNLTLTIDNQNYNCPINNSQSVLNKNLTEGNHTLKITYLGDSNYNPKTLNTYVYVKTFYTDLILKVNSAVYGEELVITANIDKNATGTVTFTINNITREITVENGIARLTLTGLNVGEYDLNAEYSGDVYYVEAENTTSVKINKANSTISLYVLEALLEENIRIYANLSTNATGSVLFSMPGYYSPRYKNINNDISTWYISPLTTGKYTVQATYTGDSNYYSSNTTFILDISQKKSILEVNIDDVRIIDRVIVSVKLYNRSNVGLNGTVKLDLNSKTYDIDVTDGQSSLVIGKMDAGNYTYTAVYEGNTEYAKSSSNGEFEVRDTLLNVIIISNNLTKYYNGSQNLTILVKTTNNKIVADTPVSILINGKKITRTTDENGRISVGIDLNPGNYTALITVDEDEYYHNASANASVTILSTVEAIDLIKIYGTANQYFAIFADSNGKPLANTEVKFKIGKNSYTAKTLPNGITRLNINLNIGTYTITAINPVTGQKAVNTIFIFQRLMENKDVTKYYKGTKSYKVRAYTNDGKIAKGVTVKIKINKKTYKVKTDSKGYATLNLNLKPKTYTITATYGGYTVKNKVVIKSTIVTKNISKKKSKTVKFKAKLLNSKGKILKNKKITFKLKGKTYTAKTNKKGIAILTIKNNLNVGKHKIKTSYGKFSRINTITVKY